MDKFRIRGGRPLHGTVEIAGAKNSALPLMAAALLTPEPVRLHKIPKVRDIATMAKLLTFMSAKVSTAGFPASTCTIESETLNDAVAPYELVKTMRASILTLGPVIARSGVAHVSLPGGCAIGARPVDLHLAALEKMGAEITTEHGYIQAKVPKGGRLKGAHIVFEKITVTGTENVLMAATLAEGDTTLENCAREPEVTDLIHLLRKMGADIQGDETSKLKIHGVDKLHGATHSIIPDRVEAGTFLIAGAITNGDLTIANCTPTHLGALIAKLEAAGVPVELLDASTIRVHDGHKLVAADVTTEEYPGFATDMQAQFMVLMSVAEGAAMVTETIFENRFMHVPELNRMGARINVHGASAIVRGVPALSGAPVMATDLRASVSLILAGLGAKGETMVNRVYHLDRGYEAVEEKLAACGADIERIGG